MRRTLLAVLAAGLTAAALPVVADATHKPGHNPGNPGPGGADLTIAANPNTTVFQGPTVISGKLKGPNKHTQTVTLREDAYPFGSGDRAAATARTDGTGSYTFTRRPSKNTTYQVTFGTMRSARVLVNVRIRMSLRVSDYTPRAGQVVRFKGRACPTHSGLVVRIQRRGSTGSFRTVRRTTLKPATGGCSAYSRRLRIRRDATYRVTADDADHATGISRVRFLNVHR